MKGNICKLLIHLFLLAYITSCTTVPGVTDSNSGDELLPQYNQSGWKNVRIVGGGFIPGIIFNTTQEGLSYVRTDMGGAYRWNPDNNSWIPLTDFVGKDDYGTLGIASIATDPVEPNRVIMATGTYTNDWEANNAHILVSEDYGDSFTKVEMPFKLGGNMPGRGAGERLAIDPNSNNIIYLGSNDAGLWRSEDYGLTWSEVSSFPTKGNVYDSAFEIYGGGFKHFFGIVWIMFDPASGDDGKASQNIYAGVVDTEYTILESNDGGVSWHKLEGEFDNSNIDFDEEIRVDFALKDADNEFRKYYPIKSTYSPDGAIIISYNAGLGPYSSSYQGGAIWKYTFGTKEWKDISLPKHDEDPNNPTSDRGVGSVAVQWDNPDVMVATTLNEWWPDEYIYRSTDGGESWDAIWYLDGYPDRVNKYTLDISGAPWLDFGEEKALPEQSPKLGWMMTDIEIDPFNPDRMMYGTGATIFGTNNLTDWDKKKKVKLEVMAVGIEETAILELLASPLEDGPVLYSGMGDIGGFVHWDLDEAPGMIVNPYISAINSIDYAESKPEFVVRMGDGVMGYSEDAGYTWQATETSIKGIEKGWSGKIAVTADASIIVWAPTQNIDVHWSDDKGKTWNRSEGIPSNATVFSDRVNPNRVYGFADGVFYGSEDAGKTFIVINDTALKPVEEGDNSAADFAVTIGSEGDIWFAGGKMGMFHSTDAGKSWTQIPGVEIAEVVGLGKEAPDSAFKTLFTHAVIDGQRGIYMSTDQGSSWERINDDEHQFGAANSTITGDPRIFGRVYLGTNGRGIQYRDLN